MAISAPRSMPPEPTLARPGWGTCMPVRGCSMGAMPGAAAPPKGPAGGCPCSAAAAARIWVRAACSCASADAYCCCAADSWCTCCLTAACRCRAMPGMLPEGTGPARLPWWPVAVPRSKLSEEGASMWLWLWGPAPGITLLGVAGAVRTMPEDAARGCGAWRGAGAMNASMAAAEGSRGREERCVRGRDVVVARGVLPSSSSDSSSVDRMESDRFMDTRLSASSSLMSRLEVLLLPDPPSDRHEEQVSMEMGSWWPNMGAAQGAPPLLLPCCWVCTPHLVMRRDLPNDPGSSTTVAGGGAPPMEPDASLGAPLAMPDRSSPSSDRDAWLACVVRRREPDADGVEPSKERRRAAAAGTVGSCVAASSELEPSTKLSQLFMFIQLAAAPATCSSLASEAPPLLPAACTALVHAARSASCCSSTSLEVPCSIDANCCCCSMDIPCLSRDLSALYHLTDSGLPNNTEVSVICSALAADA
mmetsp:Transcript_28721/g.73045  ORF Transcript_28721/g.73045 Transcript_28721/m.73045 type:complete len:475 (+) Transcript_28721:1046-2470(+)